MRIRRVGGNRAGVATVEATVLMPSVMFMTMHEITMKGWMQCRVTRI